MHTYLIKVLYRATSKTMLIRAKSQEAALKKAHKLKEHREVHYDLVVLDVRPDDRLRSI